MTTEYLDGLGRPIQKNAAGASPAGNDLVTSITYDQFGRQSLQYLPFMASRVGGYIEPANMGFLQLNPFQEQAAFMQQQYGSQ